MLRFSANLSTMFREVDLLDRPAAACKAGFKCVEMQFPYDHDVADLSSRLGEHGLSVSVLNIPCGDFVGGGEGNSAIPGRTGDFRAAVELAKRYADIIRPLNVNVLAGAPSADRAAAECHDVLAENLQHAASAFAEIDIHVVVEAINTISVPGFMLPTPHSVIDIIDRAGHPNLALQFDLFHVAMMDLPQVETFEKHRDRIGHIQFADAPGRHEPGTGDIDFAPIFAAIDASGYDGWAAAEYLPAHSTQDGLGWLDRYS
jgi:hydroxypyruvate isomerase